MNAMRPLKIAMLTKHFNFRNGSTRVIHETAVRLVARGHQVHIFCNKRPDHYPDNPLLRHVPMVPLNSWSRMLSFDWNCRIRLRLESFDIVHGHGNTIEQDILTVQVCQKANLLARRLSLSGWDPHLFLERREFQNRKLKIIVTLSNQLRKNLHQIYGIPLDRIFTVPNGVDVERFHPALRLIHRERIRKEFGLSERHLAVLFVASGNFKNRGLQNLLTAFGRQSRADIKLFIIGGDKMGPYRSRVIGMGLKDRVIFLPFSNHLEEMYAAADALIFPSYHDTFGNVPLEAMASGLPVIVTEQCGVSELIINGEDGLILKNPEDIDTLSSLIERLMDPDIREHLGHWARKTAEGHGWDAVADKTLKLYNKISGQEL